MSSILSLWRQIFTREIQSSMAKVLTMERTSVPLACQKRQLNQGDPSDETAKTQVLCHSSYCMIPSSPSSQTTRVQHGPKFYSPSLLKVSFPYERDILEGTKTTNKPTVDVLLSVLVVDGDLLTNHLRVV